MRKLLLILLLFTGSLASRAQSDSLQVYLGKYKFPDGSPVSEIGVTLENGILTATSVMGNSELRATSEKDIYEIVAYSGTATFRRGDDGKITHMRVQVQDVDMEGVKQSDGIRQVLFHKTRGGLQSSY